MTLEYYNIQVKPILLQTLIGRWHRKQEYTAKFSLDQVHLNYFYVHISISNIFAYHMLFHLKGNPTFPWLDSFLKGRAYTHFMLTYTINLLYQGHKSSTQSC